MWQAEKQLNQLYRGFDEDEEFEMYWDFDWDKLPMPPLKRNRENFRLYDTFLIKQAKEQEYIFQKKAFETNEKYFIEPFYDNKRNLLAQKYFYNSISLSDYLKSVNEDEQCIILEELNQAIIVLNNISIQHNDLNAEDNILVVGGIIKIIDFGESTKNDTPDNKVQDITLENKDMLQKFSQIIASSTTLNQPPPVVQKRTKHETTDNKKMRKLDLDFS